ncbi:NAD-dependent epimerase/dehydratase family protein [Dactylosporangium vinaceum]|uniref:NAD-dependent epimerase/dehydratase family protein n=1 Tax=Dactylosporangium vinaceum TaxID=53362 RepID=A0ABV5MKZ1_9ACTN|nr:NAD-dependent epimerase/dehydratase family protein [Dactylosporangium vinaceum]UAB93988.1 NAD-dependent epimerase/dehydratase family protein [Dactylosporangium vinaceum]
MRTLVLGGTGLISTAITRRLLDRGDRVTLLNRGTGAPPFGDAVTTVHGDRADVDALGAAWDAHGDGHDAVVDMLCYTPADARAAIEAFGGRTPHYVMCSTVDVYTKPAHYLPVDERHERAPDPAFAYAHDKARSEEVLRAAGLPLTILRPAATYADHAVASIGSFDLAVERLIAGQPVILHGDGTSRWAAGHRDDVARAFVAATARPAAGRAYNVTGAEVLTFEEYWRAVADALGVEPHFVKIPVAVLGELAPQAAFWCVHNFQYDNVFDCTAAARDLGFASTVPWARGIAEGLRHRTPGPVDTSERATYDRIVAAWPAGR